MNFFEAWDKFKAVYKRESMNIWNEEQLQKAFTIVADAYGAEVKDGKAILEDNYPIEWTYDENPNDPGDYKKYNEYGPITLDSKDLILRFEGDRSTQEIIDLKDIFNFEDPSKVAEEINKLLDDNEKWFEIPEEDPY